MSSTLNFSLKKSTLNAFWSKVILLQTLLLDNDPKFLSAVSNIGVNLFSAVCAVALLEVLSLFEIFFNCDNLMFLNDSLSIKVLVLSKYV